MNIILKNASVYTDGKLSKKDILISDGIIEKISEGIDASDNARIYDCNNYYIFPGFCDVHVHLREPGFSYKETIKTGTKAAASSGYTAVCTMPNLNPVPDSAENLEKQLEIIKKDAVINVYPFGSITKAQKGEELSDLAEMAENVIGFSDDGRGVQNAEMMQQAMEISHSLGKIISAHCEDESLLKGGYIHDGEYARLHNHKGICSESEWKPIERDICLVKETGCSYHVCHISAKESVKIIRMAKNSGVDITCETAPHYLVFSDMEIEDSGNFKMNPPIRSAQDRLELINGIKDGTIDMIATDHAPHSEEEKSRWLTHSLNGIVGLETAFPVLYTKLVKEGVITLEKLIELMSINPCKRFGIECGIEEGKKANLTVFNLDTEYTVNSAEFLSMGKSTPFEGMNVCGKCVLTLCNGEEVYKDGEAL